MRYVARALNLFVTPGVAGFGLGDAMVWALRRVAALIGLLCLIVALPLALVTPVIPVGLPLAIVGLLILVNTSETAKRIFFRWAKRYPITSRPLRSVMRRRQRRP